jgi:urease accessory protein
LMKLPAEIREACVRTGNQLLVSVDSFVNSDFMESYQREIARGRAPGTQPAVLGVVSSILGIRIEDSAFILLYSSLVALVGAAIRLGLIDHIQGQRIIHSSKPTILELSENASKDSIAMREFFPLLEIAQMSHARIDNKMFVT